MEILAVGTALIPADRRAEGQTKRRIWRD